MQYGLKRESLPKLLNGIKKAGARISSLQAEIKNENRTVSEEYLDSSLEQAELSLTILSHIQESLEEYDFVLLDKTEYDSVTQYLIEN